MMLIAAVAMFDSRRSALPDPSGTAPGGLGAGFYPFWAAAFIFVAGAGVAYRTFVTPQRPEGVFKDRASILAVLTIIAPIVVAVSLIAWIGFYVMTAVYQGYFAITIGKYRWYWALAVALLVSAAIYATFELGFRVPLPKSILDDVIRF